MNHNLKEKLTDGNTVKLEKYIKTFIDKVPQVIVQSRCGEKKSANSKPFSDVFEIAIENNPDIQQKTAVACTNINFLLPFSLCVEILLKTSDGDTLVLEAWCLKLEPSEKYWQQNYVMFADSETVFGHLMILLKSTISVTRITPAYKLSLRQGADSYVMMYRIYNGDPQIDQLGVCPTKNKIGEVYTPVGSITLSVVYRSKHEMTIAPQKADKENFMVKSDYFNADMSPKKQYNCAQFANKFRFPCQDSSINNQNVGAFGTCSFVPQIKFPELPFLEKPFLNLSRGTVQKEREQLDNITAGTDTNLNYIDDSKEIKIEYCQEKDFEKLSNSDMSDGSDFVLVDLKPPFARYDSDTDINAFYQECQSAPPLSSLSGQGTLKDQVCEVTTQLAQFELSMNDFDSFVDSVCQADLKK